MPDRSNPKPSRRPHLTALDEVNHYETFWLRHRIAETREELGDGTDSGS